MATKGRNGGEKTGGRKKGSPNRFTADIKAMVEEALVSVGGAKYLRDQAEKNPTAFMSLIGRLLPRDVTIQGSLKLEDLIAGGNNRNR